MEHSLKEPWSRKSVYESWDFWLRTEDRNKGSLRENATW